VPNRLLGRVMSVASVLAWSAIPAGALAGAAVMQATDVSVVYAAIGAIDALIAAMFWLSPIRYGDRYLAEGTMADTIRAWASSARPPASCSSDSRTSCAASSRACSRSSMEGLGRLSR